MEQFCIITNCMKDPDFKVTKRIAKYLFFHGKQVVYVAQDAEETPFESFYRSARAVPKDIDCAIVLGGDGTLIQAVNELAGKDIPILGINLGTLGFLAEIDQNGIEDALNQLMTDRYEIEERMMLLGSIMSEEKNIYQGYSLNDVVISRSGFSRIITVRIYVNQELVDSYQGDGVLIATPTGSTGYNLSAGGPVVTPSSNLMIITPICPHSLNSRSIVVNPSDTIIVEIGKSKKTQKEEALATFDGRSGIELKTGDYLEINRASVTGKMVKLHDVSFFDILRNKLGQGKES